MEPGDLHFLDWLAHGCADDVSWFSSFTILTAPCEPTMESPGISVGLIEKILRREISTELPMPSDLVSRNYADLDV